MIINPYQVTLETIPGTRMLQESFGLMGVQLADPISPDRLWSIHSLYAPIPGRKLGGIRAKLTDEKGFVTFCNQRDLEVLLELARPGDWCGWAGHRYPEPGEREWFGLCMDEIDNADDLYERELGIIAEYGDISILASSEIARRIHLEECTDSEDLWINSNRPVPMALNNVLDRWLRVLKDYVEWEKIS